MTENQPSEPDRPGTSPGEPRSSDDPGTRPAAPAEEDAEGGADTGGLSERDRALLAVERRGWPGPGAKERAIRERLGLSPTRYYQLLNALLDDPRALAHDPVTVNRLRRVREERRARR
ncbi:DUF3263 domain-containing protein [Streptomyces sp. LX-29]|uniref:DUF3263 domain-containing protein n=1 Tax=Streptomyces sp. LX-29 TaxID=2900152 RepID=UPI00240E474E|nr:DUF3263 domain-containing protein [Streptomyces sp. LX-29]